jgi:type IX secretion system PorP/SprF family membrane protein
MSLLKTSGFAQKEMLMTQYQDNQFALNPAFAGSRETLSLLAAFRQQYSSVPGAPQAQFFALHAPLRNPRIGVGVTIFNETFNIARNTGFTAAYAHRIPLSQHQRLAFSLSGGVYNAETGWNELQLTDPDDEAFGEREVRLQPALGFGLAWYGNDFFTGMSVPDFFYQAPFQNERTSFEPFKTTWLFTAGYRHQLNASWSLQPATLLRLRKDQTALADISLSAWYNKLYRGGLTWRSNQELIVTAGWRFTRQWTLTYSYDVPLGDFKKTSNGSHEISLQFDWGQQTPTVNPRFF